jgi:hypothetical protein
MIATTLGVSRAIVYRALSERRADHGHVLIRARLEVKTGGQYQPNLIDVAGNSTFPEPMPAQSY